MVRIAGYEKHKTLATQNDPPVARLPGCLLFRGCSKLWREIVSRDSCLLLLAFLTKGCTSGQEF